MHTLPLPLVSEQQRNAQTSIADVRPAAAAWPAPSSQVDLRPPAGSPLAATRDSEKSPIASPPSAARRANSAPGASVHLPRLLPQQIQFLLRVTPPALASEHEYEIPACVTIAQAILESATPKLGWGSSVLFRQANNPFGIKYCHFPSGDQPITRLPDHPIPEDYGHFDARTWEIENGEKKTVIAQFQRFSDLAEAFRAHGQLLRGPRYRSAFAVRADWEKFAERLGPKNSPQDTEHCGYSTNPSYSAELIKLVRLYRLDDPRALGWYATGVDPGPTFNVRSLRSEVPGPKSEV